MRFSHPLLHLRGIRRRCGVGHRARQFHRPGRRCRRDHGADARRRREAAECRRRGVRAGCEEFPLRSAFERGAGRVERARRAADAQMPDQLPEQARHERRSAVRRGPRHDRAVAEGAGLQSPRPRPSAIAAWAIAASSRSPSSAPSIPRSAISATAGGGAAFSRTGSDDRRPSRIRPRLRSRAPAVNPLSTNPSHD